MSPMYRRNLRSTQSEGALLDWTATLCSIRTRSTDELDRQFSRPRWDRPCSISFGSLTLVDFWTYLDFALCPITFMNSSWTYFATHWNCAKRRKKAATTSFRFWSSCETRKGRKTIKLVSRIWPISTGIQEILYALHTNTKIDKLVAYAIQLKDHSTTVMQYLVFIDRSSMVMNTDW